MGDWRTHQRGLVLCRFGAVEGNHAMHLDHETALQRAMASDHAVLATINQTGAPDLVPVCFAIAGDALAIPIDSVKPKRSTALGRIRNLERDPRATLLVEHWDAGDWTRLWWVRASLVRADVPAELGRELVAGLRARYAQYATVAFDAVLTFRIDRIGGWEATEAAATDSAGAASTGTPGVG